MFARYPCIMSRRSVTPPLALSLLLLLVARPVAAQDGRMADAPSTRPGALSETGRARTLDLAAALRLAEERSPAFARVDARAGIASGELRTAGQWPNPTLEYRRENLGSSLLPDEFVTAYIPVDLTGRRLQLRRATARGRERLAAERTAQRRDVELEVARAWVQAAASADVARALQRQFDAVSEIARVEAERAREGAVAEAVALRTRVEADRLWHALALAEAEAQRSRLALAALVGVSDDALPPLPGILDTTAAPPLRFGVPGLDGVPAAGPVDAAAEDRAMLAMAQRDRALLRAAVLAREEASLRRRVEQGGVLGDWQLQGGTKKTSGFLTGQVGLAVPLPLFNRNDGARERTENVVRDADAFARATELQVANEVLAATAQLRRLLAMEDRLRRTAGLGETIAESARVAYAEGQMTLIELLDAQRAFADAATTAAQYQANLHLARLALARAIGVPLVPGSTP